MKGTYRRVVTGMFLSGTVFLLVAINGCAGIPVSTTMPIKIEGEEEIFVARDVGRGGGIYSLRWCGSSGLIYRLEDTAEVDLTDFQTKERTPLSLNRYDTLLNCSPDGKRVLYLDSESVRSDEEIEEPKIELAPGVFGWLGHTVDMYMYETATGKRTLVARMRSDTPYDALSPVGSKILLGERHGLAAKMAVPEWKGVWFTKRWKPYKAAWFPDSSGVLTYGEGYSNIICVEFFGKGGWAKCFEQEYNTEALKTDREKRVYFLAEEPLPGEYPQEQPVSFKHLLNRCSLRAR
jgi:hypothetical protein